MFWHQLREQHAILGGSLDGQRARLEAKNPHLPTRPGEFKSGGLKLLLPSCRRVHNRHPGFSSGTIATRNKELAWEMAAIRGGARQNGAT